MKRIVLTFGLISGLISAAMMSATIPFMDKIGFDRGAIIGFTALVLAFLLVFFGIKSYRENVGGGYISFGRALSVGLLIAVISSAFYVIAWLILYYNFLPDFADQYTAYSIDQVRASGASAEQIATAIADAEKFKTLYQNPFYVVAFTFVEPWSVALPMTLISAALLRKRRKQETPGPERLEQNAA